MFLDAANIEKNSLRQGDIIRGVRVLGAINLKAIQFSTDISGEEKGWSFAGVLKIADVMVLSHSCELDRSNNMKVTSIIVAPIRDVDPATRKDKLDKLIESNYLEKGMGFSYLKYFYVEPNDNLEHKKGAVVDFSKCFSIRNKSFDYLLENKILQLDSDIARSMSLKLGLYFSRSYSVA
ncbi:hypothetical protein KKI24_28625 [bacterium]|nr:hypothetical protein [bacterium]